MMKLAVAMLGMLASHLVHAGSAGYYECTKADGFLEYSLYPCEEGQEQRSIGAKPAPGNKVRKKSRPLPPAVSPSQTRQDTDSPGSKEYYLASYKCIGRSGDILYTDARDYLAFETYRCKRITTSLACAEAQDLKTRDSLAVVSIKLSCP